MRRMLFLIALGLVGCVSPPQRPPLVDDPLLGGGGRIPTRPPAASGERTAAAPTNLAPPVPSSVGSSPAALTNGVTASAGVRLGSPRSSASSPATAPGPSSSSILPAGGTAIASSSAPATYEQIQAKLKARGVDYQSLTQRGSGSWQFLCAIPDPKRPGTRLNYETIRPCPTPLAAMESVLQQIENGSR